MTRPAILGASAWLAAGILGALPLVVALAAAVLLWDYGCFEEETTMFVRQYAAPDGRSILQKVFDPHVNDLGSYQARELSYLIDLADARAYPYIASWIDPGISLPLSSTLSSIVLVAIVLASLRHHSGGCGRLNATLLLTCFVSSFCFVSTMGLFYRSAKPVLTAVVVGWVFLLLRIVRQRRIDGRAGLGVTAGGAGIFLLTIAAGLLDRQGAFMAIVAAILLVVHARRTGELLDLAAAAVTAVVVLQAYAFVGAPWIIHALNGYWPDFSYQQVPFDPFQLPTHLRRAASVIVQNTLLLFGGNWIVSGAVAALVIGVSRRQAAARGASSMRTWIARLGRSDGRGHLRSYAGWILLSQLVMFTLMIARHPAVYWIDHRFWYYPLPSLALLLCGTLLALNAWVPTLPARQRRMVPVVLAVIVLSNVLSLGHRRDVMATGPWFGRIHPQCELLKASLRAGRPDPGLDHFYRPLFDHSVAAQAAAR